MANNPSADIRQLMALMESVSEDVVQEGIGTSFLASLGSKRAQGAKAREELAKKFLDAWKVWLGQTGREGTADDVAKFLTTKGGFDSSHVQDILGEPDTVTAGVEVPAEPIMEFEDVPLSRSEIKSVFDRAAGYAFDNNLVGRRSNNASPRTQQTRMGRAADRAAQAATFNKNRMWEVIQRAGLDTEDVENLNYTVDRTRSFNTIQDDADIKMLAVVGYAFLKANGR